MHFVPNCFTDCVPTLLRDRSLLHPSNKPPFILFSPAPLTVFH
ncbi:Uncharacterized protein APZ42_005903 [Daphnia magna]|uniref:Uncharacterized protein n=1 Tax=Daphnia magna TaxID=35525 RepID=A0A162BXA6_9CRUS|nr:Uncharacterized protein APZ42_005903 [Daphnia magna]